MTDTEGPPPANADWLTAEQAAKVLGLSAAGVRYLCNQGRLRGAKKLGWAWMIPSPPEKLRRVGKNEVTTSEAAELLGLTRSQVTLLCKTGDLKGAKFRDGRWAIPSPIERTRHKPGRPKRPVPA